MESSICRLDKELKQKQQNLFEDQSPRLSICEEDANENKILLKRQVRPSYFSNLIET